jgi:hypothetical protein
MSQEELDGPRILLIIGELIPTAMPELMGMHRESQLGTLAGVGDHLPDARIGQRSLPLREKDVCRIGGSVALQPAQGANLSGS